MGSNVARAFAVATCAVASVGRVAVKHNALSFI